MNSNLVLHLHNNLLNNIPMQSSSLIKKMSLTDYLCKSRKLSNLKGCIVVFSPQFLAKEIDRNFSISLVIHCQKAEEFINLLRKAMLKLHLYLLQILHI